MLNWQDFDAVFQQRPDFAYDHKTVDSILKQRKEFRDELFFDRIWKSIRLTHPSRKNYPPRSNQDLRNLWSKIVQTSVPDEQKLALLYYILQDCRQLQNASSVFARRTYLPRKYQLLITGLWELDHGQFARALEHLTDPSLELPFADEILKSLLTHSKCDSALATAYYTSVSPPLSDKSTLDAYFHLLSSNNVVEAYYFTQKQGGSEHKRLFEELITNIHQVEASNIRAERATSLVGLPFTSEEEAWFEECLLHGSASKMAGAGDTMMVRRIAKGISTDTSELNRIKGLEVDGITWNSIRQGLADATPT